MAAKVILTTLFGISLPLYAAENKVVHLPSTHDFEALSHHWETTKKSEQSTFNIKGALGNTILNIKNIFSNQQDLESPDFLQHLLNEYKKLNAASLPLSITPSQGDQIFVWQNLNGAFHSLLRSLQNLRERGVIDDNFHIQHNHVKIIFLGNVLGFSENISPMLPLVLTLLIKNPGKVFFLKGENEEDAEKSYGKLNQTIEEQSSPTKKSVLQNNLSQFFSSLPQMLTLQAEDNKQSMLLSGKTELAGPADLTNRLDGAAPSQGNMSRELPLVRFQNVDRKKLYLEPRGLDQLPQFEGATTWSISSSLASKDRKIYGYNLEAFGMIEIGAPLYQSTITIYTRDQRESHPFEAKKYSLLKGAPLTLTHQNSKNTVQPIFLASSMDLTEGSSTLGKRILYGTDLKVRQQNSEGGIHNNSLHVVYANDKYLPSLALSNAKDNIENQGINLFLSTLGAPTGAAMLEYAKEGKAALVFPVSGSAVFRQPDLGAIVNYRASYEMEIKALIHHARNTLLKQKFAVFSNANKTGQLLIDTATNILLKDYNVSPKSICQIKIPPNNLDVLEASRKVKECNPDVIILLSGYATSRALINEMGVQFLSNITLMGYSFITDHFKEFINGLGPQEEGLGLDFIMARVVPNPKTSTLEIVRDYREQMAQQYPGVSYDSDSLESFINASILMKALENLTPPYTPSKVIESVKSFKKVKFKGLSLTYDEENFGFSKDIWLDLGRGEWKYYDGAIENFVRE
jgi:branched-chain amino acid transport system substrate-binding protein